MSLNVSVRRDPLDAYVIRLRGEVDLTSRASMEEHVHVVRAARGEARLDLSGVSFIDCAGLGGIVRMVREARDQGWRLEVDPTVSRRVRVLLTRTGLGDELWPQLSGPAL